MGQYTIMLNNATKQLIATNKIDLRQHESLVDKLVFIVAYQYNDEIDLKDFAVTLEWLDPTSVPHTDVLVKEEDVYKKDYQRYFLPVESPLNRYAGDVEIKLVFTKVDYETKKRYKLESNTTHITISTIKDYYAVMPNESFDAINDTIDKLKAQVDALTAAADIYDRTKADNHMVEDGTGKVYLTANGVKIGDGLNLASVDVPDYDDDDDGVIDITGKYPVVNL